MARIRSIHPTIWTDEAFAMLGMASRVLLFGIWTEADDHGVFEWKPVSLKMKIFPADKVDVEPLLDDILQFNVARRFSQNDREYGLVRNFCKFQRPKKPNYKHILPEELRTYAGLKAESTEPVPNQLPTGPELAPQMEEEGGRRKEEKKEDTASAVSSAAAYAFESGVIRLKKKDFDRWKEAFSHLDLGAELLALTEWAGQQGQRWFYAVSQALAKKNREAHARIEQAKSGPAPFRWNGLEGVT